MVQVAICGISGRTAPLRRWRGVFVDTGAPISVAGVAAFFEYCETVGSPKTLEPVPKELPTLVWGKRLEPVGVGTVRVGIGADAFLSFHFIVVQGSNLPILIGNDELERHRLNVVREPPPLRLQGPNFDIRLEVAPSKHISIPANSFSKGLFHVESSEQALLFTDAELKNIHKRFGHASAAQMKKILRLSGNPLSSEQYKKLHDMLRVCDICQWYSGRRSSFKVAAEIEVSFNHNVSLDIMYLNPDATSPSIPVLHAVCNGTKLNGAWFVSGETAQDLFCLFFRGWISVFGSPHRITVDHQSNFASADFKALMLGECSVVDVVPIESHWSQGTVERHHEPLRKTYLRVRRDQPGLTPEDTLAIAVRAVNVTTGPEGVIPSLLVFGTIPRLAMRPESAREDSREMNVARLSAAIIARGAYERAIAEYRVKAALASRAPEFPREGDRIEAGVPVLVRREEAYEYGGPFVCAKVDGNRVWVLVPNMRGPARQLSFSIHNVKPYLRATDVRENLILKLDSADHVEDDLWKEAKEKELRGLIDRGTLEAVHEVPPGATLLGSRMENTVKADGTFKSRFVAQGIKTRDPGAESTTINAPTLSRFMMRTIFSIAVIRGHRIAYRDFAQAYLQSEWDLSRKVFIRLKSDVRDILSQITESVFPQYARIVKPLYGLRESGTYWHATLTKRLRDIGFNTAGLDPCVFYLRSEESFLGGVVGVLVDDSLIFGEEAAFAAESKVASGLDNKGRFDPPFTFNGTHVTTRGRTLTIDQDAYVQRCFGSSIPNVQTFEEFRSIRGKLAYLSSGTRPDIQCATAKLAQVTASSFTQEHARKVVRLAKYVNHHRVQVRYAPLDPATLRIRVFADASYASNHDHTSQLGFAIFLGDSSDTVHHLHSSSHKAKQVAHSAMSAELLALVLAYDFAEGIQNELHQCGLDAPIVLATDSKQIYDSVASSSILQEKRQMIRLLLLREGMALGRIAELVHVAGANNVADALTKERDCPLWRRVLRHGKLADVASARVYLLHIALAPSKQQNEVGLVSESSLFQATVLRDAPRIASPGCRQARDYAEPRKIVLTQDLVPRQPGVQRSPRAKYIRWTPSPAS
ncbi:Transposon Ty4-J Gag-Pol polyprotein [Porphyridium purpureum]|uniref:Transposon Ty4-J Gag-Pol polyprotein n=1 Tax=Porphyridium purpureum TaxID=35688 RepID=A0A5J4Z576_PORPP|nr:Transposon Ty4-J Gag-Pol polyprotein [Porphyridium purpureum]|eukprot:POR8395..scf295_1